MSFLPLKLRQAAAFFEQPPPPKGAPPKGSWTTLLRESADEIDRLRTPFRNADAVDWEKLFEMIPDSGHGKFWKAALSEMHAALEQKQKSRPSDGDYPRPEAVSQIEASPPDSELPDWEDLRGRAPDATGGLSSEDFVRGLRDGWR